MLVKDFSDTVEVTKSNLDVNQIELVAQAIQDDIQTKAIDSNSITILLPHESYKKPFKQQLDHNTNNQENNSPAAVKIETFKNWVNQCSEKDYFADDTKKRFELANILKNYPKTFGLSDHLALSDELISLVNELAIQNVKLTNKKEFKSFLIQAYGNDNKMIAPVSLEADIIYTTLSALNRTSSYKETLDKLNIPEKTHSIYLCGFFDFSNGEIDFLNKIGEQARVKVFLYHKHCETQNSQSLYSQIICEMFSFDKHSLAQRAKEFSLRAPNSPIYGKIQTYAASSLDDHIGIVVNKIKAWRETQNGNIGIVTSDRYLIRRLSAVLKQSSISVNDCSGWPLSTASAAAVLERLLECVENNFNRLSFLDLLKSPFLQQSKGRKKYLELIYQLEKTLINASLFNNLTAYINLLQNKKDLKIQQNIPDTNNKPIVQILKDTQKHTAQLQNLYYQEDIKPSDFISSLIQTCIALGITKTYEHDSVGKRILQLLNDLKKSTSLIETRYTWWDLRLFLKRNLESKSFEMFNNKGDVTITNLEESYIHNFDYLIIAGLNSSQMPGSPTNKYMLNENIRSQLGIGTWAYQKSKKLHYFLRLLNSSREILLTRQYQNNTELLTASPWLTQIEIFHKIAYNKNIDNIENNRKEQKKTVSSKSKKQQLSMPIRKMPKVKIPRNIMIKKMTVNAHQNLIDCPYKFFLKDILKLKPMESSQNQGAASYGNFAHEVLEMFHSHDTSDEKSPGPFLKKFTTTNRDAAIEHLHNIAEYIAFQTTNTDIFSIQNIQKCKKFSAYYVDWLITNYNEKYITETEKTIKTQINNNLDLIGRIDSIVKEDSTYKIIDYKTGQIPTISDCKNGEAVQLASYALYNDHVDNVAYLEIKDNSIKEKNVLKGSDLFEIKERTKNRLSTIIDSILEGAPLPANGDEKACKYCEMSGICRKNYWSRQ
jgi:ATP-dependent helicase/nuclease subunit B